MKNVEMARKMVHKHVDVFFTVLLVGTTLKFKTRPMFIGEWYSDGCVDV